MVLVNAVLIAIQIKKACKKGFILKAIIVLKELYTFAFLCLYLINFVEM